MSKELEKAKLELKKLEEKSRPEFMAKWCSEKINSMTRLCNLIKEKTSLQDVFATDFDTYIGVCFYKSRAFSMELYFAGFKATFILEYYKQNEHSKKDGEISISNKRDFFDSTRKEEYNKLLTMLKELSTNLDLLKLCDEESKKHRKLDEKYHDLIREINKTEDDIYLLEQEESEKLIPLYQKYVKRGTQFSYGYNTGTEYKCTIFAVGKKQIKYKEVYMHDNSSINRAMDWEELAFKIYKGQQKLYNENGEEIIFKE